MNRTFDRDLAWVREQMTVTRATADALPDLSGVRLACAMHLEIKMAPAITGLLARGAKVLLTTCNPRTCDDVFLEWCTRAGAEVSARRDMTPEELAASYAHAVAWQPTHLCEMGADLTAALVQSRANSPADPSRTTVRAALEATGSGTNRLAALVPGYPVFNWDDLPIKEGLHNRHMVGLTACHAFFERTRLTFHGKRALVVGYGLVGRSACDAARAYGAAVTVAEIDPGRALEARFAGESVVPLAEGLPTADVVITATGAHHVLGAALFARLKRGCFLINVGHASDEIDVPALYAHPHETVLPFLERVALDGPPREVYLFADGSMANLTAGQGDSVNAFDVTLATMLAGIGFIATDGGGYAPGVHVLPAHVWRAVAHRANQ